MNEVIHDLRAVQALLGRVISALEKQGAQPAVPQAPKKKPIRYLGDNQSSGD